MIPLRDVQDAAFWSQHICLDCGSRIEVDTGPLDLELTARCGECGGVLRLAAAILEIVEKVDVEDA